jgi:hypothetical protein
VRDAFFKVSVATQNKCVVVKQLRSELCTQRMLGEGETNGVRKSLSEGSRSDLDAWRVATLWMTRSRGSELAEVLDVIERKAKAGQIEHRILENRCVPAGKNKSVSIWPFRATGVVAHDSRVERVGQWRKGHGGSGMTGVRLLGGIHGKTTDDVDGSGFDSAVGHGRTLVVATSEDDC